MPHRQGGEVNADLPFGRSDLEGGARKARIERFFVGEQLGERGDLLEERLHFAGRFAFVERGDETDGAAQFREVGAQLVLQAGVKHGGILEQRGE